MSQLLAVNQNTTCALLTDTSLWCWGGGFQNFAALLTDSGDAPVTETWFVGEGLAFMRPNGQLHEYQGLVTDIPCP
jgi:hypothetical protein